LIYAIGDIHGQQSMLLALLEKLAKLPLQEDDLLLFLGDYVDRGKDSCAVIETLLELRARRDNVIFLRGNHEQLMLDAFDDEQPQVGEEPNTLVLPEILVNWLYNGGIETLYSYRPGFSEADFLNWKALIPETHWKFLRATEMEYITDRYHFVHAGLLPPGRTWEGEPEGLDPRLWIREPFLSSRADFNGRIVVFGHTPQMNGKPLIARNKIGLDTAAVFGGRLTAAAFNPTFQGRRVPSPRFYQVDNR
jgi:serine/threonine protein phosphatase 1